MPKPYSIDLRKKVIDLIFKGYKRKDIATMLNLSTNTITLWKNKVLNNESLEPTTNYQNGHTPFLIGDKVDEFKQYIENNNDATYREIANHFNISKKTVWLSLKKLNYTRKKKPHLIQKLALRRD